VKIFKSVLIFASILSLTVPQCAHADFWGADVAVLAQILVQTIEELAQLKSILGTGEDTLDLVRQINAGITDSLVLLRTVSPSTDPGTFRDWIAVSQALQGLESIYGAVSPSPESTIQQTSDQSVAEAIALNNSIYNYTGQIDQIGEEIKSSSHGVSPIGAARLTAESLGVMLHVMNQSLRTQATGLKLQAQTLAIQNHEEKERTRQVVESSQLLETAMQSANPTFSEPRF